MAAFDYPALPHVRRHGPRGYRDYASFRDWLRDEFDFRCVFCLVREEWVRRVAVYHVDHFVPISREPSLATEYDNLLYVCSTCNAMKSQLPVPSPSEFALGECVVVQPDGSIQPLNSVGRLIIRLLRLDNGENTEFRRRMLRILALAERCDAELFRDLMKYPDDLPDLATKQPPDGNTRPEGLEQSCFARRARGELPATY